MLSTPVYVVGVAASPGPGTVFRWLLLLCMLTTATVGMVGVAMETAGRPFGAASAYWASVFSFVLWAVPSAWLVRSRYTTPLAGPEGRPRHLHVAIAAPRRSDDGDVRRLIDPVECLVDEILIHAVAERVPSTAAHLPEPHLEHRPSADEVAPSERDAPHLVGAVDHSLPATLSKPSTPDRSQTRPQRERAPTMASDQSIGPSPEERGGGARELAEILNLYDRVGRSPGNDKDSPGAVPYRADSAAGERTLWGELVEDFGAESVDFRGDEAGECWITLSTGDLVFYAPERECWLWVVFEGAEGVPASRAEAPSSLHIVADPS